MVNGRSKKRLWLCGSLAAERVTAAGDTRRAPATCRCLQPGAADQPTQQAAYGVHNVMQCDAPINASAHAKRDHVQSARTPHPTPESRDDQGHHGAQPNTLAWLRDGPSSSCGRAAASCCSPCRVTPVPLSSSPVARAAAPTCTARSRRHVPTSVLNDACNSAQHEKTSPPLLSAQQHRLPTQPPPRATEHTRAPALQCAHDTASTSYTDSWRYRCSTPSSPGHCQGLHWLN